LDALLNNIFEGRTRYAAKARLNPPGVVAGLLIILMFGIAFFLKLVLDSA